MHQYTQAEAKYRQGAQRLDEIRGKMYQAHAKAHAKQANLSHKLDDVARIRRDTQNAIEQFVHIYQPSLFNRYVHLHYLKIA